jgi:hypothetical protein
MSLSVPPASSTAVVSVPVPRPLKIGVHMLAGLTFLTAMSGAFVAGTLATCLFHILPP